VKPTGSATILFLKLADLHLTTAPKGQSVHHTRYVRYDEFSRISIYNRTRNDHTSQ